MAWYHGTPTALPVGTLLREFRAEELGVEPFVYFTDDPAYAATYARKGHSPEMARIMHIEPHVYEVEPIGPITESPTGWKAPSARVLREVTIEALGAQKAASAFQPSFVAAWGASKPWDAPRHLLEAQMVPGFRVGPARGTEAASFERGFIVLKDEWFTYPTESRRAICYHEAGHGLEEAAGHDACARAFGVANALDIATLPGAERFGHNYSEVIATAYQVAWDEPGWASFEGGREILAATIRLAREHGWPIPLHTAQAGLTPYQIKMFEERVNSWSSRDRALWDDLAKRLGRGDLVAPPEPDRDLANIVSRGRLMEGMVVFKRGKPSNCHYNAASLWIEGKASAIATGYALINDDDLWRQHSWAMDGDTIIETTVIRNAYFGYVLTDEEALEFAKAEGAGNRRRTPRTAATDGAAWVESLGSVLAGIDRLKGEDGKRRLSLREVERKCREVVDAVGHEHGVDLSKVEIVLDVDYLPPMVDARYEAEGRNRWTTQSRILVSTYLTDDLRDPTTGIQGFRQIAHEATHAVSDQLFIYEGHTQEFEEAATEILSVWHWAHEGQPFGQADAFREDGKWIDGARALVHRANYHEWVGQVLRRAASKVGWQPSTMVAYIAATHRNHRAVLDFMMDNDPEFAPPPGVSGDGESLLLWLITEGMAKQAARTVYYHGTFRKLPPGTILRPSGEGGIAQPVWGYATDADGSRGIPQVWMTDDPQRARQWASDGAWSYGRSNGMSRDESHELSKQTFVYAVEPIGKIEVGEESLRATDYKADAARVLYEVDERGHEKVAKRRLDKPLPEGFTIVGPTEFATDQMAVTCLDPRGRTAGQLIWNLVRDYRKPGGVDNGWIDWVAVTPQYRRMGIAANLLYFARDAVPYPIRHSTMLTGEGEPWSRKVGWKPGDTVGWINEVITKDYPPRGGGACKIVSEVVEKEMGHKGEEGIYWSGRSLEDAIAHETVYGHWWNRMPNGDIFDGTGGQFHPSGDTVRTVRKGTPEFEHYVTWEDLYGREDPETMERIEEIVQYAYPKFSMRVEASQTLYFHMGTADVPIGTILIPGGPGGRNRWHTVEEVPEAQRWRLDHVWLAPSAELAYGFGLKMLNRGIDSFVYLARPVGRLEKSHTDWQDAYITDRAEVVAKFPLRYEALRDLNRQMLVLPGHRGAEANPAKVVLDLWRDAVQRGTDFEMPKFGSASGVRIMDPELIGWSGGQSDLVVYAFANDQVVGSLHYSTFDGEVYVNGIEVRPDHQRQGIATDLWSKMVEAHPGMTINPGLFTDDGSKWWVSMPADKRGRVASLDKVAVDLGIRVTDLRPLDSGRGAQGTIVGPAIGWRGFGSWKEVEDAMRSGGWRSKGTFVVPSHEGQTQFAGTANEVLRGSAFHTMRGSGFVGMVAMDLSGLPFRALIGPDSGSRFTTDARGDQGEWIVDKANPTTGLYYPNLGTGIGIDAPIPWDRVRYIAEIKDGKVARGWLRDDFHFGVGVEDNPEWLPETTGDWTTKKVWTYRKGQGQVHVNEYQTNRAWCGAKVEGKHWERTPIAWLQEGYATRPEGRRTKVKVCPKCAAILEDRNAVARASNEEQRYDRSGYASYASKTAGYGGTWDGKHFIRFGLIPSNEVSHSNIDGRPEAGVSVYRMSTEGQPIDPDPLWFQDGHSGQDSYEAISGRILDCRRGSIPAFVVTGRVVGTGTDGEDLIKGIEVVAEWDPRDPLAWKDTDWAAEWEEWGNPQTHFGKTASIDTDQIREHLKDVDLPEHARDGDCLPVSGAVLAALTEHGWDAHNAFVTGYLGFEGQKVVGWMHSVTVLADGTVVDATATQFDQTLPSLIIESAEDYKQRMAKATGVQSVEIGFPSGRTASVCKQADAQDVYERERVLRARLGDRIKTSMGACQNLLRRILKSEGVENAENAYIEESGDPARSMIGMDHDGYPPTPFVLLGSMMVDTLTTVHEAAHIVELRRRGAWGNQGRTRDEAHDASFMAVYEELLQKWMGERLPKAASVEVAFTEGGEYGNRTHITMEERGTIPVEVVAHMPGKMGEVPGAHARRHGEEWEAFKSDLSENGMHYGIFICVTPGEPIRVWEGNHRRDAAVELGWDEIPVQIRYFGHAERDGTLMERWERDHDPRWSKVASVEDYGGMHQPSADGPPVYDLTDESGDWSLPADIYDKPQWYTGYTEPQYLSETMATLRACRGKPDAMVRIYRALPPGHTKIEHGNWVSLSRAYAKGHAMDAYDESKDWPVISAEVPARLVRHAGDDLMEYGYWGPDVSATKVARHQEIPEGADVRRYWYHGTWKRLPIGTVLTGGDSIGGANWADLYGDGPRADHDGSQAWRGGVVWLAGTEAEAKRWAADGLIALNMSRARQGLPAIPFGPTYVYRVQPEGQVSQVPGQSGHGFYADRATILAEVNGFGIDKGARMGPIQREGAIALPPLHDTLYPAVFDGLKVRPEVKAALYSTVNAAMPEGTKGQVRLWLEGSGASFNWDEGGDLDVQVWVALATPVGTTAAVREALSPMHGAPLTSIGIDGTMEIQFYVHAGDGTPEDALKAKPYALYDLDTDTWAVMPVPQTPAMYAERFQRAQGPASAYADQAEQAMGALDRANQSIEFAKATGLDPAPYEDQAAIANQQIRDLYAHIKDGRAQAYGPGGDGLYDVRDTIVKVLEAWGIWQRLVALVDPLPAADPVPAA